MDFKVTYTIEIRVFISSFSARNFLEPAMSSIKKRTVIGHVVAEETAPPKTVDVFIFCNLLLL